jgi:hypothetical protein
MELVTSIAGSKAPPDITVLSIALGLQGSDALAQHLHAFYATRQTAPSKYTDLDLGHIQPTPMFGRIMELHPLQDAPRLWRREGFIQGRRGVRVQIILHDAHVFGLRIWDRCEDDFA